jgi:hypothetical protein
VLVAHLAAMPYPFGKAPKNHRKTPLYKPVETQ